MGNRSVTMETSQGTIKFELADDLAPVTAQNFADIASTGFYDGKSFHRYEPGFVIQGGCPYGNGTGDYKDPETGRKRTSPLEVTPELKHDDAGVVAMARSQDPNSASCQFYITLKSAGFLDMNYAVFGRVTEGLDVVQKIRAGDIIRKVTVSTAE